MTTVKPLLTHDEQVAERLRSMATTFSKADTMLFGDKIEVRVESNPAIHAPGYSTSRQITLNTAHIGSVDSTDDIIKITGLNFHELAHCLYTPGPRTWLSKECLAAGLSSHFNMLEDQRIESMLSSEYTPMKPYFVMTIMKYIASNPEGLDTAHALTYGRKFLPADVRDLLRKRFSKQSILTDLETIIDRYRVLVFPQDEREGFRLIRRYRDLLVQAFGQQHQPEDPYGHSTDSRPTAGGSPNAEGQAQAQQSMDDGNEDTEAGDTSADSADDDATDDADDTGKSDTDDATDNGDAGNGSGDGDGGEDSDGDSDHQGTGGSGQSDADQDGDGTSTGSGASRGGKGGPPKQLSDDRIRDEMNRIAEEAAGRPDVQRDAKMKHDAIKATNGRVPDLDQYAFDLKQVTPGYAAAANGFKKQLMKLWSDSDPGWHTHQGAGRVNMSRAMRGDDIDTVFDRWDPGTQDATSIEWVVLFDYSGSMSTNMWAGSQALWTIKRAVEAVGGDVTVIGYDDDATQFYSKDDKAHPTMCRAFASCGGTDPSLALQQTKLIMHYSKRKHRFVTILTDGQWGYGTNESDMMIKQLNEHAIITSLVYLGTGARVSRHECQVVAQGSNPLTLVELAKDLVRQGIKLPAHR